VVGCIKQTKKRFDGLRRSSRFHNAARALFSSYVAPLLSSSRLSFLPFVSRPADILASRFPTRAAPRVCFGFLHVSHPCGDLSIHRTDGKMQGPFLRVRMRRTAPRPRFRDMLRKKPRSRYAPSRRKSVFLDFLPIYSSCLFVSFSRIFVFAVDTVLN
jgi:hypothetical protein